MHEKNKERGAMTRELLSSSIRSIDTDNRRVTVSFASEEPYKRWYGTEILCHDEGCVDLTRLNEIGVVLFNHNRDVVIGKIIRAWVEDKRSYAQIQFDEDEQSEIIFQKVQSGTLKATSVGYITKVEEEVKAGETSTNGRFKGPCCVATKWEVLEMSIVSVPADGTVGVGREFENMENKESEATKMENETKAAPITEPHAAGAEHNPSLDADAIREAEIQRAADITALCRDFNMDPTEMIRSGKSLEEVKDFVLREVKKSRAPGSVRITEDEQDKFRSAAADALCLRAGLHLENVAPGAEELRSMSLQNLARECLMRDGYNGSVLSLDIDDIMSMREFYNPTSAFSVIADNAAKKAIVEAYKHYPTTFDQWVKKGSASDFKESKDRDYVLGSFSEFKKVHENGELEAGILHSDLMPTRKLETFGRSFSLTREAFYNDDVGFITSIPAKFAQSAKMTQEKQVYDLLFRNSTIFDGKALFHNDHKNLIASGSAPSQASIQEAITKGRLMKDQFGEAILWTPKFIITGIGYEFDMRVIFHSAQVTGSANNDMNPLYNYPIVHIQVPMLNALAGSNACPWFMVADGATCGSIGVDYLNGVETPTIRRMEKPGTLGFHWDVWLDWGIYVKDFRGMIKNNGAAI